MRLGRERDTQQGALKAAMDEMIELAPLMGKRSLAGRLEHLTKLVKEAGELDIRLSEGLASYKSDLTPVLQLAGDWLARSKEGYVGLGQEVEELVERALRA